MLTEHIRAASPYQEDTLLESLRSIAAIATMRARCALHMVTVWHTLPVSMGVQSALESIRRHHVYELSAAFVAHACPPGIERARHALHSSSVLFALWNQWCTVSTSLHYTVAAMGYGPEGCSAVVQTGQMPLLRPLHWRLLSSP